MYFHNYLWNYVSAHLASFFQERKERAWRNANSLTYVIICNASIEPVLPLLRDGPCLASAPHCSMIISVWSAFEPTLSIPIFAVFILYTDEIYLSC